MLYAYFKHLCLLTTFMFATTVFAQQTMFHDSASGLSFTVQEASEWTNLFTREHGWFGGDGIFTTPFNGVKNKPANKNSKNLIWFSDSMIGDVSDSTNKTSVMLHNTMAVLRGDTPIADSLRFYWRTDNNHPHTIFEPHTASSQKGDYYWLGDGFVNTEKGNTFYLFAYQMRNMNTNDDWSFKLIKTNLIAVSLDKNKPPYINSRQLEMPLAISDSSDENASFGAGIFVNTSAANAPQPDGFVYVYGVKDKAKNLVVARVKPASFEDFTSWTFWNGKAWVTDIKQLQPVATDVSNELSVSALPNGKYGLVYQLDGMSPFVAMQIGSSPVGPFGNVMKLYDCTGNIKNKNYFAYNAKAHPSLSAPGELLISYNVNAFDFRNELQKNPALYRPRFIKIKFTTHQ